MKRVLLIAVLVFVGAVAYAAPPNSCDLHGTWVGEVDESAGGGKWLATYHGRTRTKGTLELQFLDVSANLGPPFDAERFSPTKGVWERTGRRSYVYTMVTYGVDSLGYTYYSAENTGTIVLSEDCNSMTVDACLEYIAPNGTPFFCVCGATATATRLELQEPCAPLQ